MATIKQIFNFDDVGGKIKNLAKWSCWITILLIWIAAPITFIALVVDEWTVEFCWIPLVSAVVGPIFIWIGSWAIYAFGEFVEDTHAIREKQDPAIEDSPSSSATGVSTYTAQDQSSPTFSPASSIILPITTPKADEWKCTCGKIHKNYETSCLCGVTKQEVKMKNRQKN